MLWIENFELCSTKVLTRPVVMQNLLVM